MAERPTPYSISVCTLIALQSDPTSPLYQEVNPSAEISRGISAFLQDCVLLGGGGDDDDDFLRNRNSSKSSSNNHHRCYEAWSSVHAMTVLEFLSRLESAAGVDCRRLLLDYLVLAAVSVDSLMDLMESLRRALSDGIVMVDGTSAHGIFLRKVCLGFDQLSFESTSLLWSDMVDEIERTTTVLLQTTTTTTTATGEDEIKQRPDEQPTNDDGDDDNDDDSRTRWPLSAVQMERALRKECFRADDIEHQRGGEEEEEESSSLSFEETEVKLLRVLEHDPELPAAHFLRFLNCVQHGERVGALDALHQYFDYAIIQGGRTTTTATTTTTTTQQDGHSSSSSREMILQFASILLASLHSCFGDTALAQMATDEAVRVAQQSMDAACVAFALGWIFSNNEQQQQPQPQLTRYYSSPKTTDSSTRISTTNNNNNNNTARLDQGDLLKRCALRATEGQLRSLAAGARLTLAQYSLSRGTANRSTTTTNTGSDEHRHAGELASLVWNSLMDASSDRANPEVDDGAIDRPTHMTHIENSKEVMDTFARQKLVAAGIWDYFGQTNLSGISSFLALYCHADQMVSRDVVTAIQNIARVSLYGSPSLLLSRQFDGSILQKHLEDVEQKESDRKSNNKIDCIYAMALLKLASLWRLFRLPMDAVFLLGTTTVLHEWAIRRGEHRQAAAFGVALESYLHPRLANYTEIMIDVFSQKALLLSRQGKWAESRQLLKEMIDVAEENELRTHHASLLLQLSIVQLDSNPHLFTAAIAPLLECLTMTEQYQMDGLHATALSILAQIHLRMRNPKRAIALLQASLPSLLQREHVWFQAEAYLTLAKCRLQLAKTVHEKDNNNNLYASGTKNSALISLLRSATRDLDKSQMLFQKCQDCLKLREIFYLQARTYDSIPGEQQQRETASESFLRVSNHLASSHSPHDHEGGILNCLSSLDRIEGMARRRIPVMEA